MPKATKPVSVAGIEFDALIGSDYKMEATVPEYATDNGFSVSDAIMLKQETLDMVLYLTDTPVTWYTKHAKKGRVEEVCKKLEELYYKRSPVKVVTSDKTYTDMAIESLTISKSLDIGYAREIPISFRKIRTTKAKTTNIPSSYGKSGTSQVSVGTASTSSGSSGSSGSSSYSSSSSSASSSKSSSGSSSSGSSSGSSGSILFNIGKSSGIIK